MLFEKKKKQIVYLNILTVDCQIKLLSDHNDDFHYFHIPQTSVKHNIFKTLVTGKSVIGGFWLKWKTCEIQKKGETVVFCQCTNFTFNNPQPHKPLWHFWCKCHRRTLCHNHIISKLSLLVKFYIEDPLGLQITIILVGSKLL